MKKLIRKIYRRSLWQVLSLYAVGIMGKYPQRRLRLPVLVAIWLLPSALPLLGQAVTGSIVGRVTDEAGLPLPDVEIIVEGKSLQVKRTLRTDRAGGFRELQLPTGVYSVEVGRVGFRSVTIDGVVVRLATVSTIGRISLEPTTVNLPNLVVVAETPILDPLRTDASFGVEAADHSVLPILRQGYAAVVQALPHANASFIGDGLSIAGSTGLENAYFIDGVNVTNPIVGGPGVRLPWNFMRSLTLRTAGYQAEYGRALGGIIDAVTITGSDRFEATGFGYYSGGSLASEPRIGLTALRSDAPTSRDVGVQLRGLIVTGRLWYAAGYGERVDFTDREITGQGVFRDREAIHSFVGKLSWRAAANTEVDISVFGDPSERDGVGQAVPSLTLPSRVANPEVLLTRQSRGGVTFAGRIRKQLGRSVTLNADVSRHATLRRLDPSTGDAADLELLVDNTTNIWSGGPGIREDISAQRTTVGLSGTLTRPSLLLKIGATFERNRVDDEIAFARTERNGEAQYQRSVQFTEGTHQNHIPTVFIENTWQALPKLTLVGGIRWSRQHVMGDGGGSQTYANEWQPRVGIVFQPRSPGGDRLFASYGRFYQQVPLYFSTLFNASFEGELQWYSQDPRIYGVVPDSTLPFTSQGSALDEIEAENQDEFTIGYERTLGRGYVIGVRAIHRDLRTGFGYGIDTREGFREVKGNFGEEGLAFLPKADRKYGALELTVRRTGDQHRVRGQISYVLSRTHGNYPGLFNSDQGGAPAPHNNPSNKFAEQGPGSTGLLPNDRTHVVKLLASYRLPSGPTIGLLGSIQSGVPLNEFGAGSFCSFCPVFLVPRGTGGRSTMLWDMNLRVSHAILFRGIESLLVLDWLHIGNPRRVAWTDQTRFLSRDEHGNQANSNPTYGEGLAYQAPMALRLGLEVRF